MITCRAVPSTRFPKGNALLRFLCVLLCATAVSACGGGEITRSSPTEVPPPPNPPSVAAIVLSAPAVSLIPGQTSTLTAETRSATGVVLTGRNVSWSTANPAVATVSEGVVTGVGVGTTQISATSEGQTASAQVSVRAVPITRLVLSAVTLTLQVQNTAQVSVQVIDSLGRSLSDRPVTWSSNAPTIATVTGGLVTALAPGAATVTASIDGVSAALSVTVTAIPVSRIVLSADSLALAPGDTRSVTAETRSATGALLSGRPIVWSSSAPAIASVSGGTITAIGAGAALITATSEGVVGTVRVNVALPPVPPQTSSGDGNSCAIVLTGEAYCWGENSFGELGFENGGNRELTARPVSGGLRFIRIATGNGFACGLSTNRSVYCWGQTSSGTLGDDTRLSSPSAPNRRPTPGPIASTARFSALSSGRSHVCAVSDGGEVYCWGFNANGQLGDGTTTTGYTPRLVSGIPPMSAVAPGEGRTCAIDRDGGLWCWGSNQFGRLGDGTAINRPVPVRLPAARRYVAVATGIRLSCALDDSGAAWCWGQGPIGDGTSLDRSEPTAVSTSQRFMQISVGSSHACALATDGKAWCWGSVGTIGDGANSSRNAPVQVSGDRRYTSIAAGYDMTCAAAVDGIYCWGSNSNGELGNGTRDRQLAPVKVLGLPSFVP